MTPTGWRRRSIGAFAVATAAGLVGCGPSSASGQRGEAVRPTQPAGGTAAPGSFRIGHAVSEGSLVDYNARAFASALAQATGGRIQPTVHPNGELGAQQELLEKVQLGALEMVASSSDFVSAVPEFGVFDLPYLFPDRAQVKRLLDGPFGRELTARAERRNLIILAYGENGYRHVTNNVRPIRSPDDLHELRIRTPPNPDRIKMFHLWGARPAPLDFNELFAALQAGTFDGQENPVQQIVSSRFSKVQRYISFTRHVYTPAYLVASKPWWDALQPAMQRALRDAAVGISDDSRQRGERLEAEGNETLRAEGMEINDDVDVSAFVRASAPLYDEFRRRFGSTLLDYLRVPAR